MKGLILSGGFGTRLRPITSTTQKQLIPIANKPIIFYVIEDLIEAGITDIGIIIGPNKKQVMDTVGDGSRWDAKITYIQQDNPLGLAHCILISKDFLNDSKFVMYLGDNILKGGIKRFVKGFTEEASIMLTPVPNPSDFGIAELNKDKTIHHLAEKPKKPRSNLAVVGIYAFKKTIHKAVRAIKPSARGELEIVDAIQWLLDHGKKVQSANVEGWWKDTGRPNDLLEGNELILDDIKDNRQGKISQDAQVRGRVIIEKGAEIRKGSLIQGPAIIGKDTIIEQSSIGPYTSIGKGVTIINTEIDRSIVMDDCTINCGQRIVNSLIGTNCSIMSYQQTLPHGHTIVVGDNSQIEL